MVTWSIGRSTSGNGSGNLTVVDWKWTTGETALEELLVVLAFYTDPHK
jgi:hypothetical protein